MKNTEIEEELIDLNEEDGSYITEEELLEDDEISAAEEAFLKGYGTS